MIDNRPRRQSGASRGKWTVLAVVSIATFMSTFDGGMVNVSYPALATAFDIDPSTVLWVSAAFWATSVGLLLTLGWLGDVAGRRRMFTLGFVVFTLALVLAAGSSNIWQLIGARIFQAFGSAMMLSNLNAIITATFPTRERGKALGFSGAVVGVGLSAGPLAGGLLLDEFGWRALFYSRVPLGLLGAALGWWLLPRDRVERPQFTVDYLGAFALFGTLASFLLVVNQGGRLGFVSPKVVGIGVGAAIFLSVLVWAERRSVRPIVDFMLFKTGQYGLAVSVLASHYLSHMGVILVAPFFLSGALGFSATKMGLFIAAFFIGRTFLAPSAGQLSDRFGPRSFLVLGNLLMAVALLWLSRLGLGTSEVTLLSALLLAGIAAGLFEPVATSFIMGSVPNDRLGTASASVATGRQLAFAVGVAVAGAIFTIRERVYLAELADQGVAIEVARLEAIARGFSDTLLAGAVLAAVAVALSLRAHVPDLD